MNLIYNYEKAYLEVKGMPCTWRLYLKPKPYAHSKSPGGDWKPDSPEFRIIPETPDESDLSMTLFRADIPENFAATIAPFPTHQWMLLRMFYEGPACLELALSNPVLAFCVANNAEFRTDPENRVSALGKLCLRKQKDLLDWLRFPASPAMLRMFQKILPGAADPSTLRMLRLALKTTVFAKTLGHMKQINAGVLSLIANRNFSGVIMPRLLLEVSERQEERTESPLSNLLFETLVMQKALQDGLTGSRLVFESAARVQAVHDELLPQYNAQLAAPEGRPRRRRRVRREHVARRVGRRTDVVGLDPWYPPIPGTSAIMPITSPVDLYREGKHMHNCVATYKSTIQDGRMYIYRILEPERATLAIRPYTDGKWCISQLKGVCNQKVSQATKRMVKEWLTQHNLDLPEQAGTGIPGVTPAL